jgi:metal-sulfur cluster biosynthetic enzyme
MNTPDETALLDALRQVIDPELGCNLVDLGLIYSTEILGQHARVTMTLTTAGCPMHESLLEGARTALLAVPGIATAEVTVVWDPPWNPAMMTPAGRARVGLG